MSQTIKFVELDANGEPMKIEDVPVGEIELPCGDVIILNPGVPPLHSKEFVPWLAQRNRELNGRSMAGLEVE